MIGSCHTDRILAAFHVNAEFESHSLHFDEPEVVPEAQAAPVLGPLEGDSGSPYESRTHRQTVAGVAVQLAVAALGVSAQAAQRLGVSVLMFVSLYGSTIYGSRSPAGLRFVLRWLLLDMGTFANIADNRRC